MLDVARKAGVSQTTVSFVLNRVPDVSIPAETRQRVVEAASALGYRTNRTAQSLRTKSSNVIGLITDAIATSPFAGNIVKAAQELAADHGKVLMLVNTGGVAEVERAAVEMMIEHQVEGVIYAAMWLREVEPPANLGEVPAVLVNCFAAGNGVPSFIPDERFGGSTVTKALLDAGHRRIGFVNGDASFLASRERLAGYRSALRDHQVPYDAALVSHGSWWPDNGYRGAKRLMALPDPPTAVFCGNDRIALGAYHALKEAGIAIPEAVAVVGYDGEEIGAYLEPPLSSFTLPHAEMGSAGMRALLAGGGERSTGRRVKIRGQLIERGST